MSKINRNTADKEELMKLRDIGDKRASLLISERKTKGPLTLESVKLISGIPSNIWDPLFLSGKIVFGEEGMEE